MHRHRGGKYSFFEGGINVVGMLRYPRLLGAARAGAVYDGLVHACDWYATLATLGGASPDDTGEGRVPIDGLDVLPALASGGPSPRTELLLGMGFENTGSLRSGEMKLLVGHQMPSAWVGPRYPNASTPTTVWPPALVCQPGCLYNLTADPREEEDLAAAQPALLQRLLARYGALVANLSAPNGGDDAHHQDPAACAAAEAAGGWWTPWGDHQ